MRLALLAFDLLVQLLLWALLTSQLLIHYWQSAAFAVISQMLTPPNTQTVGFRFLQWLRPCINCGNFITGRVGVLDFEIAVEVWGFWILG